MKPYKEKRFEGNEQEVNDAWLDFRRGGVGGSDVAAIMGISSFRSPLEVWLEKTGRVIPEDISDKPSVYWGTVLEDVVAAEFAGNHPELKVTRKNAVMVSKERPWAFASVDRLVSGSRGRGVLEIKTAGSWRAGDWAESVPVYYMTQVAHYLSVTGFDYAWVAVLIGGQDYREYYIERDEEDITAVREAVDEFWNEFVATDTMPQLIGTEGERDALVCMYPEPDADDDYIKIMSSDLPELEQYIEVTSELKDVKRKKNTLAANLMSTIGEHKGLRTESHQLTWTRPGRLTVKGLE